MLRNDLKNSETPSEPAADVILIAQETIQLQQISAKLQQVQSTTKAPAEDNIDNLFSFLNDFNGLSVGSKPKHIETLNSEIDSMFNFDEIPMTKLPLKKDAKVIILLLLLSPNLQRE